MPLIWILIQTSIQGLQFCSKQSRKVIVESLNMRKNINGGVLSTVGTMTTGMVAVSVTASLEDALDEVLEDDLEDDLDLVSIFS